MHIKTTKQLYECFKALFIDIAQNDGSKHGIKLIGLQYDQDMTNILIEDSKGRHSLDQNMLKKCTNIAIQKNANQDLGSWFNDSCKDKNISKATKTWIIDNLGTIEIYS